MDDRASVSGATYAGQSGSTRDGDWVPPPSLLDQTQGPPGVTPHRTPRTPKPVTPLDASSTPSARKRGPDGEAGSSRGPGKTPRKALFVTKRQSGVAELMGGALDVIAADRARKAAAGGGSGPGGAGDQQQPSTSSAETTVTRSETVPVGLGSLSDQTQTVPVPSGLQQSTTTGNVFRVNHRQPAWLWST